MASKDSDDAEIPSLNSIPPPDEGGVEEVTRVGSHAEIQKALEGSEKLQAAKPAEKPSENIKTPTVPLPAVQIDKIAKVGKTDKIVEELEDSALEAAAPSRPPGAPPLPAGARKKAADEAAPAAPASSKDAGRAITSTSPATSNTRLMVIGGIVLLLIAVYFATR